MARQRPRLSRSVQRAIGVGVGAGFVGLAAILALVDHPGPATPALPARSALAPRSSPTSPIALAPGHESTPVARGREARAPEDGSELAQARAIAKDEREAAQVFRHAAETDPARFARWMEELAANPTVPTWWLLGGLASLDRLSPAERVRLLARVARGQEDRAAAVEDAPDGSLETIARRQIAQDARAALVGELGPAGIQALVLDPSTAPEDRLLVAAAALEQKAPLDPAACPDLAAALVHDLRGTADSKREDEQRVAVVANLPSAARTSALVSALEQPGLADEGAHLAIARLGEGTSADLARTLAAHAADAGASLACPRLALAYALVAANAPDSPDLARAGADVVSSLERCVATGSGDAPRMALAVLARRTLPASDAALQRLAAGEGGSWAGEAREILGSGQ